MTAARLQALGLLAWTLLLAGCAAGPVPMGYGTDRCAHCQHVIRDNRFAAQAASPRGEVYKFEDVACLAEWLSSHDRRVAAAWVADYEHPGKLIPVGSALYMPLAQRSPDGHPRIAAFAPDGRTPAALPRAAAGRLLGWEQLRGIFASGAIAAH